MTLAEIIRKGHGKTQVLGPYFVYSQNLTQAIGTPSFITTTQKCSLGITTVQRFELWTSQSAGAVCPTKMAATPLSRCSAFLTTTAGPVALISPSS